MNDLKTVVNTSGIHPKGATLLVRPEAVESVSKGGIVIPMQAQEKESLMQMYGTLIEVGSSAWKEEVCARAQPGERVIYAKYAGHEFRGNDGGHYRLMRDKDLIATIDQITKGEDNEQKVA